MDRGGCCASDRGRGGGTEFLAQLHQRVVEHGQVGALLVRQLQVTQHSLTDIEVKMVLDGPMPPSAEAELKERIRRDLGADFVVKLNYVDHIPRSAGGKFEDFICAIDS